ncbi:hypothetical protein IWX50DRAFT_621583 [Phyllosticta citricarpa]
MLPRRPTQLLLSPSLSCGLIVMIGVTELYHALRHGPKLPTGPQQHAATPITPQFRMYQPDRVGVPVRGCKTVDSPTLSILVPLSARR